MQNRPQGQPRPVVRNAEPVVRTSQQNVQQQTQKLYAALSPKYDLKRLAAFICDGMWGFIVEGRKQKCPFETIRTESKELLNRLMSITLIPALGT